MTADDRAQDATPSHRHFVPSATYRENKTLFNVRTGLKTQVHAVLAEILATREWWPWMFCSEQRKTVGTILWRGKRDRYADHRYKNRQANISLRASNSNQRSFGSFVLRPVRVKMYAGHKMTFIFLHVCFNNISFPSNQYFRSYTQDARRNADLQVKLLLFLSDTNQRCNEFIHSKNCPKSVVEDLKLADKFWEHERLFSGVLHCELVKKGRN